MAVVLVVVVYACGHWSDRKLRASVEETRQRLRRDGFKTELTDFDLTVVGEMRQRADRITGAAVAFQNSRALTDLQLMKPIGSNVSMRTTLLPFIPSERRYSPEFDAAFRARYMGATQPMPPIELPPSILDDPDSARETENLWVQVAEELRVCSSELDGASDALIAGPFRFEPVNRGGDFLLPYLANLKGLAQALSARSALAVHENRLDDAFTNLLALTQLSTHWQPEPIEISHLVRFACVAIAQAPLWEALQSDGWSDAQLAALQQEWEAAEFFAGLPETAALQRASMVQLCRNSRKEPFMSDGWGLTMRQLGTSIRTSPINGFRELKWFIDAYRQHLHYQDIGSYEDEKRLLIYFLDRELETRRALTCQTWMEMRALPGVTNLIPFQAAQPSRIVSMMNLRQMTLAYSSEGRRLLGRAAETETRRRLMVTAIALKRFQIQPGRYPETLAELTPALLRSVPVDFMDGKELRYQRFEDGRMVLYSVGLDCVDNGGQTKTREQLREQHRMRGYASPFSPYQDTDIVWPMPATEDEVAFYEMSTDETVIELNEVLLQEIQNKYAPPRPEENVWPFRQEFE